MKRPPGVRGVGGSGPGVPGCPRGSLPIDAEGARGDGGARTGGPRWEVFAEIPEHLSAGCSSLRCGQEKCKFKKKNK